MKAHYGFCMAVLGAACLLAVLDGCAATDFEGLHTGSRIYDARIAYRAGATQTQVDNCEARARAFFSEHANDEFAMVRAGREFERCVGG